jgi:hypothetical protein
MDRVVKLPVPALGQPADPTVAGGHFDRCGAVIGGEVIPTWEPADVADQAEHGGGDDRSNTVEVGQPGLRRRDHPGQPAPGIAALFVEATQIGQQYLGKLQACGVSWSLTEEAATHRSVASALSSAEIGRFAQR